MRKILFGCSFVIAAVACGGAASEPAPTPTPVTTTTPAPTGTPTTTPPPPPPPPPPTCEQDGTCIKLKATDPESRVQAAFATAKPGQRIELGPGTFKLTNTVTISTSRLVVRGAGLGVTILDFSGQKAGSDGIYAENVKALTFEAFSVVDTKGNGIKTLGADIVVMRKLGVSWTGADASKHGPYGLYPVQSKNVLVEDCVVSGASDSGVYLGQSDGAVLRRNDVHHNVAGIEVENTFNTDVYENKAHDNTGGILVFDLPGLPQKGGRAIRVHDNVVEKNNTENFAPAGNIVGIVPRGTGILVMANKNIEVFGNKVTDNTTFGVAIATYFVTGLEIKDPGYDPFASKINVHDNVFTGGGNAPDPKSDVGALLAFGLPAFPDNKVSSIVIDGITNPANGTGPNPQEICIRNNGTATFANLHLDKIDPQAPDFSVVSFDASPHDCTLPAVPAPSIVSP